MVMEQGPPPSYSEATARSGPRSELSSVSDILSTIISNSYIPNTTSAPIYLNNPLYSSASPSSNRTPTEEPPATETGNSSNLEMRFCIAFFISVIYNAPVVMIYQNFSIGDDNLSLLETARKNHVITLSIGIIALFISLLRVICQSKKFGFLLGVTLLSTIGFSSVSAIFNLILDLNIIKFHGGITFLVFFDLLNYLTVTMCIKPLLKSRAQMQAD